MDQVGIDLRTIEHGMTQEGLYSFQPHPALQQVGRNRVAQRVRTDFLRDTGLSDEGLDPQVETLPRDRPAFVRIDKES